MKARSTLTLRLDKIVGGGQALGTAENGQKVFVWGGLPGELVEIQITKKKNRLLEGVVINVIEPSVERVDARDPDSYLSTSPWQIMNDAFEMKTKSLLIAEAFELHNVTLPFEIAVKTDDQFYGYRNKVEFSFWFDVASETVDLAFFRRGTHGKLAVQGTSLARPEINEAAVHIRNTLRTAGIGGRDLKTIMLRSTQASRVHGQLYVKNRDISDVLKDASFLNSSLDSLEIIYSNPLSPASVITERLALVGQPALHDEILGTDFVYVCEGFFQVNIPMYEAALADMAAWIPEDARVVDMYSGVGSIGLTIGGEHPSLVEIDLHAVEEMRRNVERMGREATIVHASSESALEHITETSYVIVDPPRAGLHSDVVARLLEVTPPRIIYLSCNPVTQARDVSLLLEHYTIASHTGYNFFPRTPHIEHLVILDKK